VTTTTLAQPWLFAVSTTVLVLETLARRRVPSSVDPFSKLHPHEVTAAQLRQENLPVDLPDRLQAVIDATGVIQQPWDEGRSVDLTARGTHSPGCRLLACNLSGDTLTIHKEILVFGGLAPI